MRTPNDYNQWNKKKQIINEIDKLKNVRVGEVRRYYCGVNIGNEIGKGMKGNFTRVCLVLKTNLKNELVLVAPLSTKLNVYSRGNTIKLQHYDKKAWVICNQVCLIDRKRFSERRPFKYSKRFVRKVSAFYQRLIRI